MVLLDALLLFLAEAAAFVAVGEQIGFGWALLLLLAVSAFGPFMVRRVGTGVLTRTRRRLVDGETPTGELLDGVVVLLGGVLICVPGFITDTAGLLLLVGPIRRLFVRATGKRVARRIRAMSPRRWNVINVTARPSNREPWEGGQGSQDELGSGPRPDD